MSLLDAKSLHMKARMDRFAKTTSTDPNAIYGRIRIVNSSQTEVAQTENQLSQACRNATSNLERVEVLRDRLEQLLDRLRGPTPKAAPEQEINKMVEQGTMLRLTSQHERTSAAIETAIQMLSEIEQYV